MFLFPLLHLAQWTFFFFFFFFFAFPSYISGVHHFWVRYLRMWPFFNPTIKVVTFRLRGWCVLGVFLLPAFTRLGHECQDLFESVRWNACVHRLDLGLYSHPKEFWGNGVWTHVNSKGKIPSTGKCPQRSIEPATLWQRAQALPTELFRPPMNFQKLHYHSFLTLFLSKFSFHGDKDAHQTQKK